MGEKSDKIEQIMKMVAIWQPKAYFEHDGKKFFGQIIGCEEDALIVEKEDGELISVPCDAEFHSVDEHDDQHTQSIGKADQPFGKLRRQVWKYIHQNDRRKNSR